MEDEIKKKPEFTGSKSSEADYESPEQSDDDGLSDARPLMSPTSPQFFWSLSAAASASHSALPLLFFCLMQELDVRARVTEDKISGSRRRKEIRRRYWEGYD